MRCIQNLKWNLSIGIFSRTILNYRARRLKEISMTCFPFWRHCENVQQTSCYYFMDITCIYPLRCVELNLVFTKKRGKKPFTFFTHWYGNISWNIRVTVFLSTAIGFLSFYRTRLTTAGITIGTSSFGNRSEPTNSRQRRGNNINGHTRNGF